MTSTRPSIIEPASTSGLQRSGGVSFAWDVEPSLADALFGPGSRDPDVLPLDRWQEEGVLELVKTGHHRTVYRLELPGDLSGTSLYIKRYRAADWKARCRRLARGATSRREYRGMVAVAELGVPTAQVVAVGGPLWPGHDRDSWLVTVGVPGARPLDELLADNDPGTGPAFRREVVSQTAEILARK